MFFSYQRYLLLLTAIFASLWLALAIDPLNRRDWLLENVLVFVFAFAFALSRRRFILSRISITLIFVFLCLHEIGAHYTYAEVPYDAWIEKLTGHSLQAGMGWERNHFDRVVHFSYGLLLAYPIREVLLRFANVSGVWGYLLPLILTMSTSMMFELFEWGAANLVGGDLGAAYLGTQGDVWDSHQDMAMASLGALLAMLITLIVNWRLQPDFTKEWAESFKVKRQEPLGETAILQMLARERRNIEDAKKSS